MSAVLAALKRIFKWLAILAIAGIAISVSVFAYFRYADLTYGVGGTDWQFSRGFWSEGGIQHAYVRTHDGDTRFLQRRVYRDDKQVIEAYLDERELVAIAYWFVDCTPGTKITTSVEYSDGGNPELLCLANTDGDQTWLRVKAGVSPSEDDDVFGRDQDYPEWKIDYDGYIVNEDFGWQWDWGEARRANALNKATDAGEE